MNEYTPWTEKYRPRDLKDIVGQKEITALLRAYVKEKNMPNLLFAGPPGIGKTTAALALARDLYGENYRESLLELNASVAPETPILVRENKRIKRVNFHYLAKKYFTPDNGGNRKETRGLEILSVDKDYKVRFMPASRIFRHKVGRVARILYEGGEVRTSLDHSVIVLDEKARMVSRKVEELEEGDLLITFAGEMDGGRQKLELSEFMPATHSMLRSGLVKNPKLKHVFEDKELNERTAWMMGLYLAEGCLALQDGTSGQVIFTVGYPQELQVVDALEEVFKQEFGLSGSRMLGSSGFDRTKKSSMQFRVMNTQLAKYFSDKFYDAGVRKHARTKRIPSVVFSSELPVRVSFLQGYMGDATGKWEEYVRYSSRSEENLIDVAWLGRICGISTSIFKNEVRAVWKLPSYSYIRTELLPSESLVRLAGRLADKNPKYYLRHQLYSKKSKRISKEAIVGFIGKFGRYVKNETDRRILENLTRLCNSVLSATLIKKIEIEKYDGYVYDVSVPGSETFFGGTAPVLLHNSDERGIDVVRGKIKDFARTVSLSEVPFKIIFLDEADSLTNDAQNALRRTMEVHVNVTRFILSANYSTKIIEPLQSRCSVFRFRPLTDAECREMLERVAEGQKLKLDEKAIEALLYVSEGDMRRAINSLQGASLNTERITAEAVYKSSSRAEPGEVKEMMELALERKFIEARKKLHHLMINYGMSGEDVLLQMYRTIDSLSISEREKVTLVDKIGEYNFRLVEGANEMLQIEALLAQMLMIK